MSVGAKAVMGMVFRVAEPSESETCLSLGAGGFSLYGEMFIFCAHNLEIIADDFLPVLTERVSSVRKSALYRVYIQQVHYELHFSLLNCITN